jgi:hypothetical protein
VSPGEVGGEADGLPELCLGFRVPPHVGQDITEIDVRYGVGGFKANRRPAGGFGFGKPLLAVQRAAEHGVSRGEIRCQPDRLAARGFRFLIAAEPVQDPGQAGLRPQSPGVREEHCPVEGLRAVKLELQRQVVRLRDLRRDSAFWFRPVLV